MTRAAAGVLLFASLTLFCVSAQESAPAKLTKAERKAAKAENSAGAPAVAPSNQPTEIYAEQAFFDSAKNTGIFNGHVVVNDPRFNIQSDKLTVYISKDENGGLEKAVAVGNVGVIRDRPDPRAGRRYVQSAAPTMRFTRRQTATWNSPEHRGCSKD